MLELRAVDEEERRKIEEFVDKTCGCKKVNGGPCSIPLADKFGIVRARCAEMDKTSLDFIILGQLMALTSTSSQVTSRRRPSTERVRKSYAYYHEGVQVCQSNIYLV